MLTRRCRKGFSTIEYVLLLIILMSTLILFKDNILRGFGGRWKGVGDQFGFGRQFEPKDTVECAFDSAYTNSWYDSTCLENKKCPWGNDRCERNAVLECQSNYCTN